MNGKRAKLKEKRHFIHEGKLPFWEEFEQYLIMTRHHLVINGDGLSRCIKGIVWFLKSKL